MKHIHLIPVLLLCLTGIFLLTSCSKNDAVAPSPTVAISDHVQSGTWRITSFINSGKDETSHFSGFTFIFGSNNLLTASNGSSTYTGTWTIPTSNSYYGSADSLSFNILFNLTNDFESISEDWQVVSQTSTKIELTHVSGGNGGTDFLTFEKS